MDYKRKKEKKKREKAMEKKSLFLRFSVMCLVKMKKMLILHHVEKNKNTSKIKKK